MLRSFDLIEQVGAEGGARAHLNLVFDVDTNHTNRLIANCECLEELDEIACAQRRVWTLHHVDSKNLRAAARIRKVMQEISKDSITVFKLVIAEGKHVKAHLAHHRCISLALEERVPQSARDCVTSVQLEHVCLCFRNFVHEGHNVREATLVYLHLGDARQ